MSTLVKSIFISLALGLVGCASSKDKAKLDLEPELSFSLFLSKYLQNGSLRLEDYLLNEEDLQPTQQNTLSVKNAEDKELLEFYKAKSSRVQVAHEWRSEMLANSFRLPTEHSVKKYYNTHIIWAMNANKERIVGFRPIDTSTGCNSGCTPVVFHLELSPDGKTLAILQDPHHLLRKLNHNVFSQEDMELALRVAQDLPLALKNISEPRDLADEVYFPPQTWTLLKPFLVSDGVYTSYRIYEAALKSYQATKYHESAKAQEAGRVHFKYILKTRTLSEAVHHLKSIQSLSSETSHVEVKKLSLKLAPFLFLWLIENGYHPYDEVKQHYSMNEGAFCAFKIHLLTQQNNISNNLLRKMYLKAKSFPACSQEQNLVTDFIVAAREKDLRALKKIIQSPDFKSILSIVLYSPESFLVRDPSLLKEFMQGVEQAGERDSVLQLRAELAVRFPKHMDPSESINDERYAQYLNMAELNYKNIMKRKILGETRVLNRNFLVKGGLKNKSKHVLYIFFASWCPHCQKMLKDLAAADLGADLWSKLALIEVFYDSFRSIEKPLFCKKVGLGPELCKNIVTIKDNKRSESQNNFYESIGLFSIPRLMVVDANGKIIISNYDLPNSKDVDLKRDLNWLFEIVQSAQ